MLYHSTIRCIDIDCRFAAVDALGNFFKSLNNTSVGVAATLGSSAAGNGASKISRNTLGATSQRILPPSVPDKACSDDSSSADSVDDTLLQCLHVMVSNLHACVAQSSPMSSAPVGLSLLGGILDRIFISVLRTLIALYAYLHTLNLNMKQRFIGFSGNSADKQYVSPEQRQYHQHDTVKSRKQAQLYVPEVLSEVQRILHQAFLLLKIENKFSRGEKEYPASDAAGQLVLGDHDSTVRFLHHSLQLIATVFLFEQPGALVYCALLLVDCF
jgi:hypothetical protein